MSYLAKFKYKSIGKLHKLYWRLIRPFSIGVRALIVDHKGRILLVRHSYGAVWYLPGGGVDKGEPLLTALRRELAEELGLRFQDVPGLLGTYSNFYEGKNDFISIFIIRDFEMSPPQNVEIDRWQFFKADQLPEGISKGTRNRIAEFRQQKPIDYLW